ncbi:MAG TPA: GNAT family N-acetyltransferase [Marmoricola sp.]|nr:GNAT family N-acetyltransferase [Marmoricola sp.]
MSPAPQWRVVPVPFTHPDATLLIEEVQQEYVARYGDRDDTPLQASYFEPPLGAFYVGYLGTEPVATGAWRIRTDVTLDGRSPTAEVKRMYVVPRMQRRGLAQLMLAHLEETARSAGAAAMILETGSEQPEAIALYRKCGYQPIPGFGYYRDSPKSRSFGKPL